MCGYIREVAISWHAYETVVQPILRRGRLTLDQIVNTALEAYGERLTGPSEDEFEDVEELEDDEEEDEFEEDDEEFEEDGIPALSGVER